MDSLVNLQSLVDEAKCFATVRRLRWPEAVRCPVCESDKVARHGHDDRQPERQRYRCTACQARFDDLTDTIFAGHHQPLRICILCLYFRGLNLSNQQIARELDLNTCAGHDRAVARRHHGGAPGRGPGGRGGM
jgi:transposase-like protein